MLGPVGIPWSDARFRGMQMNVDDLILVSIDDHVVEPPDMFDRHAPAKYRDRVPHVATGDDASRSDRWVSTRS